MCKSLVQVPSSQLSWSLQKVTIFFVISYVKLITGSLHYTVYTGFSLYIADRQTDKLYVLLNKILLIINNSGTMYHEPTFTFWWRHTWIKEHKKRKACIWDWGTDTAQFWQGPIVLSSVTLCLAEVMIFNKKKSIKGSKSHLMNSACLTDGTKLWIKVHEDGLYRQNMCSYQAKPLAILC